MKISFPRVLAILPALLIALSFTACDDDGSGPSATDFEVVLEAIGDWWATSPGAAIAPSPVNDDINGNQDYFILSVRAATAYAAGHLEGATNIPWRDVAEDASLLQLPTDETIVVYCYTGHTGGLAAAALGIMGYTTENMKWGMMNWSDDTANGGVAPWTTDQAYGVEQTVNTLTTQYELPDLEVSTSSDPAEIVQAAAQRWLDAAMPTPITTASALFENLNDGDTTNDPIIISIRGATDYAAGHIPGAVNFSRDDLQEIANLRLLDPDREIVVYCYTGHSAGHATTMLLMLGYNAKNMKYGMMDWNVQYLGAPAPFAGAPDYPTVTSGGE
jgi:rhodanese-related sulfurtransferase